MYTLIPGFQCTIIMDNTPAQRCMAHITLTQGYKVGFLPLYLLFVNITEQAFSIWKTSVKKHLSEVRGDVIRKEHNKRMASVENSAEINVWASYQMLWILWWLVSDIQCEPTYPDVGPKGIPIPCFEKERYEQSSFCMPMELYLFCLNKILYHWIGNTKVEFDLTSDMAKWWRWKWTA